MNAANLQGSSIHVPLPVPNLHVMIPAAGQSRRMGQPKLLLELGGETVIARLVQQLRHPRIASVSVLLRQADLPLQEAVCGAGAEAVLANADPPEMRQSVELLLSEVERRKSPSPNDGWLLIPADHPLVVPQVLAELITVWLQDPTKIVVPRYGERRGHPTLFPWAVTHRLAEIPPDRGVNWLLRQPDIPVVEVETTEASVLWDLDTPEDLERFRKLFSE